MRYHDNPARNLGFYLGRSGTGSRVRGAPDDLTWRPLVGVLKWIVSRFIEAYAEVSGIELGPVGSMTCRRQSIAGGLEPDEAYYFQNHVRARGREIDLEVDPPPDLAVEIDLCRPDVEKASIYARLGVPEIWRCRGGRLSVLALNASGSYAEVRRSIALPDFALDELREALDGYPQAESLRAVEAFRRRLREKLPRG
jgi:hypothetical protein